MSTRVLTVSLPTSTLYVSGTVNGVETIWTNTEGQSWETTADRSADDVYVVELTIINDQGVSSESAITLYYGLHLITDRTEADVIFVRNLAEAIKAGTATEEQIHQYLNVHQKGAYTSEDLNRVEAAVDYVARQLHEFGYLKNRPIVRSWSMEDLPSQSDIARYFMNVRTIRNAMPVWKTTPNAPTGVSGFDMEKANNLEQILLDVEQILNYAKHAWFYSGDLYSSEV